MELVEYPDREIMAMDIANKVVGELGSQLKRNDTATLVVPGGTTPGPIFDMLSGTKLDWSRVKVMLSDERWVPEDDPRSNTRLVKDRLFRNFAAEAQLVPLYAGADSPEDTVQALIAGVEAALPITVAILGMGGDMHTASLFPGANRLPLALADDAPSLMAMHGGGAAEPRITLTPAVLRQALSIHVVITGAEKRLAVEKARKLPPERAPIAALLRDSTVHWAA